MKKIRDGCGLGVGVELKKTWSGKSRKRRRNREDSSSRLNEKRVYSAFESFQHEVERARDRKALYYRTRLKNSLRGDGFESFLSFVRSDETQSIGVDETISVKLTCSNRLLPLELGIGDICEATDTSPNFASFQNITIPLCLFFYDEFSLTIK